MYKISVAPEEIEKLPLGTFKGEICVVSRAGRDYNRAIFYLRRQKILGFDTETRPVFNSGQPSRPTALLQVSGPDKCFLFRLNHMGMRRRLTGIFKNPDIIKVGAACFDDIRGLKHYRDFEAKSVVDLQKIAWEWGIRDKSVKKLAANILGVKISKSQQLSNWEADTLNEAQALYAATDAWVCLEMYKRLLTSEKHPLTYEETIEPQQLEQMKAAAEKRAALAEQHRREEAERREQARLRRLQKKKNKHLNDKTDTEEGA